MFFLESSWSFPSSFTYAFLSLPVETIYKQLFQWGLVLVGNGVMVFAFDLVLYIP